MDFEKIIEVEDMSVARILVAALKAHGFHPLEGGADGLPGMPGITGVRGTIGIEVPGSEAADARLLAEALVREMADQTRS